MAVNIVKKPFGVDFIKNDLEFVFKGDNLQVAGSKSVHGISFFTEPPPGKKFTLVFNGKSYEYTVISTTQTNDSIFKLLYKNSKLDPNDVLNKLKSNLYISNIFDVEIEYTLGFFGIRFTSKNFGNNTFSFIHDKSYLVVWNSINGIERKYKENYKIWGRFNLEYAENGNAKKETTPEFLLDVDSNGYAKISLDILKSIAKGIDLPTTFSYTKWKHDILNHLLIKYSLDYSEMFESGDNSPVKWLKKSAVFFGINGLISSSGSNFNKPEWIDIYQDSTVEKCAHIRSFGCDNNQTYESHRNGKDYLYVCLFDISKPSTHSKAIKRKYEILYADGNTTQDTDSVSQTLVNYTIARIPVFINSMNVANKEKIISYKISLFDSDAATKLISRTYNIINVEDGILEFLFQNKYGVLEYFFVKNKKIESNVKGDEIVINNISEINIHEKNKIFQVNTGFKRHNQLKIIESAAHTEHNFIIIKNKLIPIYIIPESIAILDDDKDLQHTTFKFKYKDKNTEEIVIQNIMGIEKEKDIWEDVFLIKVNDISVKSPASFEPEDKFNESNLINIWNHSNK